MTAPFPVNTELTAVAISYTNQQLIADSVLPRVPVNLRNFSYLKYDVKNNFELPNTLVGRKSRPNQKSVCGTEVSAIAEDHGLDDEIPYDDINNAKENYDPLKTSVNSLTETIKLSREVRVANLVFNKNSYSSTNYKKLSQDEQFDNYEASDPLGMISEMLETPIMRPTHIVIGGYAFQKLRRHPKVVKAVHGNSGDEGFVKAQDIADLLELDAVLVGRGRFSISKKKDGVNLAPAWGNHLAMLYLNNIATTKEGTTFGYTAEYSALQAADWEDKNVGVDGGKVVRVYEKVKEIIAAKDLGFFMEEVVS